MLMPKKIKYRKVQRGRLKGRAKGGRDLLFGDYGLVAVDPSWVTARQIESIRVAVNRKLKKIGEIFLRVFPDKPITKKPAETRMGKGKGSPEFWVAAVKRGKMIVEIKGSFDKEVAKQILKAASYKLPMKTRFVARDEQVVQQSEATTA
ncbi:MAG: 50S ribosomal protein L16 [Epsilonproteobacteria bacterium]|nr:50S ribosomal protein L16 [Campylobacterota bacterium]